MSQVDSLTAPDRKTHELIRMAVTVVLRNHEGVRRHAMLAHEVGATWEEVLGSIMLTTPGVGLLPAVRRSRSHATVSTAPRPPKPSDGDNDVGLRGAVPHPAEAHRPQPELLAGRRAGRARLLALPGRRLLHPSARSRSARCATRRTWRPRPCRGGRRSRPTRSTTSRGCRDRSCRTSSRSSRSSSSRACGSRPTS